MSAKSDASQLRSVLGWLQPPSDDMPTELQQAGTAFRNLVDSLPLNVLFKDAAGRRIYANKRYLKTRNATENEILGKTDADLYPPALAKKFTDDDEQVLRSGEVLHETEEYKHSDGSPGWIERFKGPILDVDGNVVGVQVLFWDVTDRHEAIQALNQERYLLHSLMDNIPDAVYFKDDKSRFLRISRAQSEKFGFDSPDEAIGKSDAEIFSREHAEKALQDERRVMATGEPIVARLERHTWPDRDDTWASTTKVPLRDKDGNVVGTFGVSRDVTELKHTQDELRKARDEADAANKAKSDFLANMSHELRTPMNAIIGMTELLLDTRVDSTQREYLRMVQESGESLLCLLNDILDFSKIEAGHLELDIAPFDVRDCIGDTLKSLALRAHSKDLELAFSISSEVPFVVAGDAGRLRQIIVNLVGNAIKFTDAGEVVLTVTCQSQINDCTILKIAVRDTGIGIPVEKQDLIFQEFQQADNSTTRTYGGTGLGLAISTRLVRLMGGELGVESEPDRGSTFFFTATFGVGDATATTRREEPVVILDAPVLIVDDNATNRRILQDMLTNWGMKPSSVQNASDALERLQQATDSSGEFRAALLDVNMPGASGYDLARWIRADTRLTNLPLLMLTSGSRSGESELRRELNIAAHMFKPVKQSELYDQLVTALSGNGSEIDSDDAASDQAQPFSGAQVLLAEDNIVNQKLAVGVLKKLGCVVTVAHNGREAVTAWEAQPFDVVLMDIQMPEMDGFEATAQIREREKSSARRTLIVAMTAHAMTGDRERCLEAGMDDYLSKPVRFPELRQKLSQVLHDEQSTNMARPDATSELFNWSEAVRAFDDDADLLTSVVEAFLGEADSLLEGVESAVASGDAEALARSAHTLKGSLLSIGSDRVAETAAALEGAGRVGDPGDVNSLLATLQEQMKSLLPVLAERTP